MIAFLDTLAGTEFVFLLLFLLIPVLIPVIALIDILRSEFRQSTDKLIWVIVVLCLNIVGVLLYAMIGRNQRIE
ncbi:hypothetical protein GCM10028803_11290 [Larkinella knui]|uniref:PLDc_N domain-containing protein n=1 Tax=Larkinella knui TaxID=2025310 RepID=A0A3P1CC98_9BACT|nr:PLD nuclease N-terminal domain-containing protein [Larkinella knui]RRB10905.1 PLDc_N domain-containing protein [Larkinella knui]